MQTEQLSLQEALLNKQNLQDYECHICCNISLKPVQCTGPCRKKYCAKCVSDWKMMRDSCPLKCSQPFFVTVIKPPAVNFKCPYDAQKCKIVIQSAQKFQEHYSTCQFIRKDQKHLRILKKQYKCFKEHYLQFFLGTYQQMCESKCQNCKEEKLCRSICRKCDQLYCVFCRPPLCSKKSCPLGHKLNYQKFNQVGYICDLCGVSTSITNRGVYDDAMCNFGLCEECYNNLPDEIQIEQAKSKSPYLCNENHKLSIVLPQINKNTCKNCQKQKFCPKFCSICQQIYCLDCKMGIISQGKECLEGHQLVHYSEQFEQNVCIKCQVSTNDYYADKQCKIILCSKCFDYQNRIQDNKNRYVQQICCNKGHQLKFYSGENQYINECIKCGQNKSIRLYCDNCIPTERTYCCGCKPLKQTKMCYFGHTLEDWVSDKKLCCHKCTKEQNIFKKCYKCNYFICVQCQKNG